MEGEPLFRKSIESSRSNTLLHWKMAQGALIFVKHVAIILFTILKVSELDMGLQITSSDTTFASEAPNGSHFWRNILFV